MQVGEFEKILDRFANAHAVWLGTKDGRTSDRELYRKQVRDECRAEVVAAFEEVANRIDSGEDDS